MDFCTTYSTTTSLARLAQGWHAQSIMKTKRSLMPRLFGGFSVNSRYRILDALPFTQSIKFDMELWHWRNTQMNYAPTTFWYARPGAKGNVQPDPETAALPVP